MHRIAVLLAMSLIVAACGGGGGGGSTTPPVAAPSDLTYVSPVHATLGVSLTGVTPTVTGTVTSYTVSPALPTGLTISSSTGAITGTPTVLTASATYTVTASNAGGNTTFGLSLAVVPAAPTGLSYPAIVATKGIAIRPLSATVTGSVDTYTVNPALPAGLFLDAQSGTISGTPKVVSALKVYTISATNGGGVATFGLNVTVNAPPATASGIFRTRVQGMDYTAGTQHGPTGADGQFNYDVGSTITFKIGHVQLGVAATPGPLLFAVDLIAGGTGSNRAVINIDRFLQMLDLDGNPKNGIEVTQNVRNISNTNLWTVNFDQSDSDFATSIQSIIADANAADAANPDFVTHQLPTAATSQAHIKKIFQCAYSGGFIGEYKGTTANDDHGRFGATVKPDGSIEAFGDSLATPAGVGFDSLQADAVAINQARSFTVNDPDPPFPLAGNFLSPDNLEGTWNNNLAPVQSGTIAGTRLGPSIDQIAGTTRHFTGDIELSRDPDETVTGIMVMDVGLSGQVTGFVYRFVDGNLVTVVGTLDTGTNAFTGTVGGVPATATLAPAGGTHPNADFLDGTFTPAGQAEVSFFTDGCSLE